MTREEAIKWLIEHHSVDLNTQDDEAHRMAIEALERETKAGHWIVKDGREQGYDIAGIKTWYIQIKCDKCGFIKTAIEGHTAQYKFCPHCGTKMSGITTGSESEVQDADSN